MVAVQVWNSLKIILTWNNGFRSCPSASAACSAVAETVRYTCRYGCVTSTIASNQVLHLLSIILIRKCNSYVTRCRIRLASDATVLSISGFYSCYRIYHSPLTAFRSPGLRRRRVFWIRISNQHLIYSTKGLNGGRSDRTEWSWVR